MNIYLPKGWPVKLILSCAPTVDQVKRIDCDAGETASSEGAELILRGLSTTHTPVRTVTLVHAVKQPLADSYFDRKSPPLVTPQPDSPTTNISGELQVGDGRSTGVCVVKMKWDEYIDDPAMPEPQKILHTESLVQIPNYSVQELRASSSTDTLPIYWQHSLPIPDNTTYKFSDGSFRQINFGVDAVSRFQNFFAPPPTQAKTQAAAPVGPVPASPYVRKSNPRLAVSVAKLNTKTPDTVSFRTRFLSFRLFRMCRFQKAVIADSAALSEFISNGVGIQRGPENDSVLFWFPTQGTMRKHRMGGRCGAFAFIHPLGRRSDVGGFRGAGQLPGGADQC